MIDTELLFQFYLKLSKMKPLSIVLFCKMYIRRCASDYTIENVKVNYIHIVICDENKCYS